MPNHFEKIDAGELPEGHILAVLDTPEGLFEAVLKQPQKGWETGVAYVVPSYYPEGGEFFSFLLGGIGQYHETLEDARQRILLGLADRAQSDKDRRIEKVPVYVILADGSEQVVLRDFKPGEMYRALDGTFGTERSFVAFPSFPGVFYTSMLQTGGVLPLHEDSADSFWKAILKARQNWEETYNYRKPPVFDWRGRRRVNKLWPSTQTGVEATIGALFGNPSEDLSFGEFVKAVSRPAKPVTPRRQRTLYWLDENADIRSEPVFEPVRTHFDGKQGFYWMLADYSQPLNSIPVSPGRIAEWPSGWGFAGGTGAAFHCRDRAEAFKLLTDLQRKLKAEIRAKRRSEHERVEQSKPYYSYTFKRDIGTEWSTSIDWARLRKENPGTHPILVEDEYAHAIGQPHVGVLDRKLDRVFWYMTLEDAEKHGKHRYRVYPNLLNG